ncbi:MAG: alpha/beta hydrolase [Devosia nanyangense]|uniref:Alpha/beta hydrolase n=1 Tax=Devosia nanyangense TaxID=1228055 RepID=A0A933NZZ9_9HYPH|nr:alpha/beta hydrolase [Devosia nanyangense]
MKAVRRILTGVVVIAVLAYGGVLVYFYVFQRDLQYERAGDITELSATTLSGAAAVSIPTGDGQVLAGWYQAPQAGKPLILYYRGNSGSFTHEHERYEAFAGEGYGFLAFDYRGFPGSPGELTEEHLLADALAAFDWAMGKGVPIVIWGRSLGSGAATYAASRREADALYLETPFLNFARIGSDHYPYLPVGLLLFDQYPQEQWIRDVTEPVFVAHGTGDKTIDVYQGKALYELAPNKAGIWIEPDAGHSDLWARGEWERAKAFFVEAEAAKGR